MFIILVLVAAMTSNYEPSTSVRIKLEHVDSGYADDSDKENEPMDDDSYTVGQQCKF